MIRPSIGADPYCVRAPVVGAIHQEAANAGRSHFPEGDFRRELGHGAPSKRHLSGQEINLRGRIHLAAECMCGTVDHIALKANGPA
jgi:hypothetical protein